MPAAERGQIPDEENMVSWSSSDPTMAAGLEGWKNYRTDQNRWWAWDGTAWRKELWDADTSTTPAASKIPLANGSGNIDGEWIADGGLPIDKIAVAASAAIMRAVVSTGAPDWKPIGTNEVVTRLGASTSVDGTPIPTQSVLLRKASDITTDSCSASQWLGRTASGDLGFKGAAALFTNLMNTVPLAGTSFPSSPADGQPFYHQTHGVSYHYDATASGWLSDEVHEFFFSATIDVSTTVYMAMGMAGTTQFTDTLGPRYGFAVKVVGISLQMQASGTGDVQVFDDGSGVTGATLSLSSQQGKDDDTLVSSTIAAGSIIGVKRTSGTIEGPSIGQVRLRRFET